MYKLLTKAEDLDRIIWVYSRDGGKTRVVYEGPPNGDAPGDIMLIRLEKAQRDNTDVPHTGGNSFSEIMRKNAANKKREAAERIKTNKSTLQSYRIKH